MISPLIEKYGDESRWVNWKLVSLENGKKTKVRVNKKTGAEVDSKKKK